MICKKCGSEMCNERGIEWSHLLNKFVCFARCPNCFNRVMRDAKPMDEKSDES